MAQNDPRTTAKAQPLTKKAPPMAVTVDQLVEAARKVLESRGFRVQQVEEAVAAEAVAATERSEANVANDSEDAAIAELKQFANDYVKE